MYEKDDYQSMMQAAQNKTSSALPYYFLVEVVF